jgi:hypothetical protein
MLIRRLRIRRANFHSQLVDCVDQIFTPVCVN